MRDSLRSLGRNKAFTATVVVALALGIGVNAAIFSVINGVLLRPLPFPQSDRLVQLYELNALSPAAGSGMSAQDLDQYRSQSASFDTLIQYEVSARYLQRAGERERVMAVGTERDFFTMLGVAPIAGRTFRPDDAANVAVVGETFWRDRLGADPGVVGRSLLLDAEPVTIIGVMPGSFQFPYGAASLLPGVMSEARTELWRPFGAPGQRLGGRPSVAGRLKSGVLLRTAYSELQVIAARLEAQSPRPGNPRRGVRIERLSDVVVAPAVRHRLFLLFGAVGLVLALAIANVTNLSLVRATQRNREVALRAALGAGPLRLSRQLLTESLTLSLLGGAIALGLAMWGIRELKRLAGSQLPRAYEVGLDWQVFLFLLAACIATGLLVGLAPAVLAIRIDPHAALQEAGGRSTMGAGARRLRDGLVVAEIAFACALAIAAALLLRELIRLRNTNSGMITTNVVTFHLGQRMAQGDDGRQFYEVAERVAALPGVTSAGFIQVLPLQSWGWTSNSGDFTVRGRVPLSPVFPIGLRYVTPDYFRTLGIPIRRGRAFTTGDTRSAPPVILINETLARRYFGDADPTGTATTRGTIIGVVGDIHDVSLDRPAEPELYYPIAQNWSQVSDLGMSLLVRTEGRPEALIDPVRNVVRQVNPDQAILNVKTMAQVVSESLAELTLFLALIASFAGLALVLAVTGTYGVIAHVATSRTREFAIRSALGADRGQVTRLVLAQGLRLTVVGLILGVATSIVAAPLLRDLPVGVRPLDVATAAPVVVLIGVVALAACLLPARHAAEVDPMSALRND